jgi:hypothetical protein
MIVARRTRGLTPIAAFVLVCASPAVGNAAGADLEDGRTGKIQFESSTPSDEFSLIRKEFADYERSCTTRGATIGGNAKARARAYVDGVEFLQRIFGAQAGQRGAR